MAQKAIFPVKIALTHGDYYTLWAPSWKEHGEQWQGFLGAGDDIYFFTSPASLLAFLESGSKHDLQSHPNWGAFMHDASAARALPTERNFYDIIGAPLLLAGRPSHENVSKLARIFAISRSLADVLSIIKVQSFFSSYSVLRNVDRGSDHYQADYGKEEWNSIGRLILEHWDNIVDELDAIIVTPEVDSKAVEEAQVQVDTAIEAVEKAEKEKAEKEESVDPYDISVWGEAGIDPIRIKINGRTLYTLRTYLGGHPVFLGRFGEIITFPSRKNIPRWIIENDKHDLTKASTWENILAKANDGSLEIPVHPDNVYDFTGISEAIAQGPEKVNAPQLINAYELLADAADWSGDDGVNSVVIANPRFQEFLSYIKGKPTGYVPESPYTEEVNAWKELEKNLIARFSKF